MSQGKQEDIEKSKLKQTGIWLHRRVTQLYATPLKMETCHLLPTKFARDESRSLPRPLLAAEGATVAVAEGAID